MVTSDLAIINIKQGLSNYVTAVNRPSLSAVNLYDAATNLSYVFDNLVGAPTSDSLAVVWNFFLTYQNTLLIESNALVGISVLSPTERFQYTLLYALFRQATYGQTLTSTQAMLSVMVRSPIIVDYLQMQAYNILDTGSVIPQTQIYPAATEETAGVVQIGAGLAITSGIISLSAQALAAQETLIAAANKVESFFRIFDNGSSLMIGCYELIAPLQRDIVISSVLFKAISMPSAASIIGSIILGGQLTNAGNAIAGGVLIDTMSSVQILGGANITLQPPQGCILSAGQSLYFDAQYVTGDAATPFAIVTNYIG